MKIVQLCPYAMARPGGVQRHVRDLSDWLSDQGHETRIIAPPGPGAAPRRFDRVTEIGHARSLALHGTEFEISYAMPWVVRRLAAELRDWGADLVHMHTPWTPMMVGQVWRALKLPTITTIHATLPSPDGKSLHDWYIRRAARYFLRRSQTVVTPSDAPVPLLRQLVPGLEVSVLPPAVDLTDWRAARALQKSNALPNLVFLGRLENRKGVTVLLDAWSILAPGNPDLHLTIAGDGAMRHLVEDAVRSDPTGRLNYVGRLDDADARALVAKADLFLAPAPYGESFGIVLSEAMAAGAVPIAAANSGYASVMTDLGADLLVAPGDPAALANMVEGLVLNPRKILDYRDWGIAHSDQFDVAQVGASYLNLYRALI